MKFRTRLLILLLIVALLPLSISFLVQRLSILHFGNKLAEDTRSLLDSSAQNLLHTLVEDYARILKRDRILAFLALENQVQAVERTLFSAPPEMQPGEFFFAGAPLSEEQQSTLKVSQTHLWEDSSGTLIPIPVSYTQQSLFLPQGVTRDQVQEQLARIGQLTSIYHNIQTLLPNLFLWQYTSFTSGLHSSYPGKAHYPANYDPRTRPWYRAAMAQNSVAQTILTDLSTGSLILTLSKQVRYPDGSIAGVTALDIDYRQFFNDWKIPAEWADETQSMILIYHDDAPDMNSTLEILLRNSSQKRAEKRQKKNSSDYLDLTGSRFEEILQDLRSGHSAVRLVRFQGQDCLLAYGARAGKDPFPMVVVPYQRILAKARDAKLYVNRQISLGLSISALLTIIVVAATIMTSFVRARKVTRPVMQLAQAAEELAAGNFSARVQISSGDELENLGQIFNSLGDRLEEREKMLQSLALAKEIQQHLLPANSPHCPGFDLAGKSIYCDETGGDYYDFIRLNGSDKLGLAVGDVSGHGIGSALVMATARGALHSLVENRVTDLADLFTELNHDLCHGTSDSSFMTLFYGVLNPDQQTLEWISAGQAPIFYFHNGEIEELECSAIPLGIDVMGDYQQVSRISFAAGDILLIGTDGIWETRNEDGEMFGTEKVRDLLHAGHELAAAELVDRVLTEINLFRGAAAIEDDITLMIVRVQP